MNKYQENCNVYKKKITKKKTKYKKYTCHKSMILTQNDKKQTIVTTMTTQRQFTVFS